MGYFILLKGQVYRALQGSEITGKRVINMAYRSDGSADLVLAFAKSRSPSLWAMPGQPIKTLTAVGRIEYLRFPSNLFQ